MFLIYELRFLDFEVRSANHRANFPQIYADFSANIRRFCVDMRENLRKSAGKNNPKPQRGDTTSIGQRPMYSCAAAVYGLLHFARRCRNSIGFQGGN